jgi:ribosomal protein L7Ae-like RNA K-turn-binding protein
MDAVKAAKGKTKLLLLANDAGDSTKREAARLGNQQITLPYNKDTIGGAVGRKTCAILAVIDEAFGSGILEALQMEGNG